MQVHHCRNELPEQVLSNYFHRWESLQNLCLLPLNDYLGAALRSILYSAVHFKMLCYKVENSLTAFIATKLSIPGCDLAHVSVFKDQV